jgi:hypothetical protein
LLQIFQARIGHECAAQLEPGEILEVDQMPDPVVGYPRIVDVEDCKVLKVSQMLQPRVRDAG